MTSTFQDSQKWETCQNENGDDGFIFVQNRKQKRKERNLKHRLNNPMEKPINEKPLLYTTTSNCQVLLCYTLTT